MTAPRPLRDVRVVDFTMGWSGPLATRHLADMGAEIIKIEACERMDWWRGWEVTPESLAAREHETSAIFNEINRNKLGIAIDLKRPEGHGIALKLVERADAVIENQATGVMAKLGLSYEDLARINPQIIMLSLPAFGTDGPWSGYRGYGSTVEHGAGLPLMTGDEDGPPVQTHVAYGDACGGLNAAAALLVALFHRRRSGEGQRIDLSQVECLLQHGFHGPVTQGLTGAPPRRTGNRHPVYVPHGCFACVAADTWLTIAVTDDAQWPALCRVIDRPDFAEADTLASAEGRRVRETEITAAIAEWAAEQDAEDAMQALQHAGVPAGALRRPSDVLDDPGFVERGFWQDLDRDVVGVQPHPLSPWRYNGARGALVSPAPTLGEHNQAVLEGILGMSQAEVAALESDGVIGRTPYMPTN